MDLSRSPRVLVVDDVPQERKVFGRFLAVEGMEPSFAADGEEALIAARASRPDLVLCDLEMPRMNGIDLCAALRADAATCGVPIVVVTGGGAIRPWRPLPPGATRCSRSPVRRPC